MTIYEKLAQIQSGLKVPKDLKNNFGGYSYRSAESILRAFKEKNEELKLGLILNLSDEVTLVGNRFYLKTTAILTDSESTKSIFVTALARETESKKGMDEAQITGAASSYARKYALNGLFAIDDGKDPDFYEPEAEDKAIKPKIEAKKQIDF